MLTPYCQAALYYLMERKKVLYVITKSVWGGAQRYVYDLATGLPKDKFDVTVAAGGSGPLFDKLHTANIRTINIPGLERDIHILNEIIAFWGLLKIFRSEKPDVIHLNSSKIGALGALAAFFYKSLHPIGYTLNPRVVFTVHGWGFKEERPFWQKIIIWFVSWFSSLFQNKIILINTADFYAAKRFIPHRKLVLIFNGINLPDFLPRNEARAFFSKKIGQDISPDTVLIGTIAELTKNKGLTHLIDAVSQIFTRLNLVNIKTIIIGGGKEKNKLQNQISQLKLQNSVHLVGFLPDASRYLKASDAFVLPSLKEGLPYTIIEAVSAGLPVVASRVGGIPDLVTDTGNGLLVEPKNSVALADALGKLIKNQEEIKRMGAEALKIAQTRFKLQDVVEKTEILYNS